MDFSRLIENIPDYKEFLTVDEMDESSKKLAAEYPDKVQVFEAGKSRKGHPIYCLKIGSGAKNAFMFGCPHPNEPMGAMMLEYFSRAIVEDDALREQLGYTWYLIKSIDVDGTQLNEKWFKGPFTLTNYARNYFRPAGYEQAEWTFPMHYKNYHFDDPIPETQVLMKIIDEVKPVFMYSLHNSGFGGTYWYLTKNLGQGVFDRLYNASHKQNIPLHLGEPEVNYIVPFGPAIFPLLGQSDTYDYYEQYSKVPPEKLLYCGESSGNYAGKYGTVTLVTELPYFFEERIQSDKEMPFTRREAALTKNEFNYTNRKQIAGLYEQIKGLISADNPHAKMVEVSLRNLDEGYETTRKFLENSEEYAQPCKESEAFDNLDLPKFFSLFSWTLLRRSCEHELEKAHSEAELALLEQVRKESSDIFDERAAQVERDIHYEVTPIRKLVSIQLESGMIVASELNR